MPLTLSASQDAIDAGLPDGTYSVMLLESLSEAIGLSSADFTVNSADINVTGNTLIVGSGVVFGTSGTLPAPLQPNTAYRVVSKAADVVQVARLSGGSAIAVTDTGTGAHSITSLQPVEVVNAETITAEVMADVARFEIAAYPAGARPQVQILGVSDRPDEKYKALTFPIDNSTGTTTLEWEFIALILNGSTTPGDTSGTCRSITIATPSPSQVPAGESRNVPLEIGIGPC